MKVIALGGAGDVGRTAVREVVQIASVRELVIADRDDERAGELAASLADVDPKVTAVRVDINAPDELDSLLADADVVLNMVGPFYRFGAPVLDAAIRTGTHYLDICDDWEPTIDMLARDAAAREAGITAIIGMGGSPGASNLLALLAARALDDVSDIYTAWPIDVPMPGEAVAINGEDAQADANKRREGPSAAIVHWIRQISGKIRVVRDGAEVEATPLMPLVLDYPRLGQGTAYTVGHPEPLTLAQNLGISGQSACLMIISPMLAAAAHGLREAVDSGRLTIEQAADRLSAGGAPPTMPVGITFASHGALPSFFALARGRKNGVAASAGARVTAFPSGLAATTAVPLVIVLHDLLAGQIRQRGVFAPEQVVDPDTLFAELTRRCAPEGVASIVSIETQAIDHNEGAKA